MAYYRGDYYRGRGRGDLFGVLSTVGKGLAGFLTGGPIGAATALFPQGSGPKSNLPVPMTPPTITLPGGTGINPGAILPGGQPFLTSTHGAVPAGYHWAKDGSGKVVRNRSMNPANPRALRRAIRREGAFVALAKRALKGSGYTFKRTGAPRARRRARR
jgi:hypothetical protein